MERVEMKESQVMKFKPPIDLINELCKCFNLKDINDSRTFTRITMQKNNTINKIIDIIPELMMYMIKNKSIYFLNNLNSYPRCVTLLKHFIFFTDYQIVKTNKVLTESNVKYKITIYSIQPNIKLKLKINKEKCIVDFS
jgi:hypothetical protein